MAKNVLYAALKKDRTAKERLQKHTNDIEKHKQDIERIKDLIIKDTLIAESTGANEMFTEFGLESDEIRLGALLYVREYIDSNEDPNRALDELYGKGKAYLDSLSIGE